MKKLLSGLLFLSISSIIFLACSDNSNSMGTAKLEVRLTDDPADYDAVNIDIQDVQINVTGDDDKGWQSLDGIAKGVYNLLDLVNDKDTLLANTDIPTGRLHQLRLILGPNNSIEKDGTSYPLQTPSAQQSGLKLNIQQDVNAGVLYTLLLDFEAARSVIKTGNGSFILKPVIRTTIQAAGGSIKGYIVPPSAITAVYAIQGTDTVASTFSDLNGGFLVKGIPAGSYQVYFWPADPAYLPVSKTGIMVNTGQVTIMDTVKLQP